MKTLFNIALIINAFCMIIAVSGCVKSNPAGDGIELEIEEQTDIRLFLFEIRENVISKATNVTDNAIRDVNILVYNVAGNILESYYFESPSPTYIQTSTGNKTIIAIANAGNIDLSSYSTLASIRSASSSLMFNSQNEFLMAGEVSCKLVKGGSVSIYLKRLVSKITVVFDKKHLDADTYIEIKKIALKNVPAQCKYLISNAIASSSEIMAKGDSLVANLEPILHSSATPLFMLENNQGTIGSQVNESFKNPGTAQPLCSYIEITADYQSPYKYGIMKYRFFLGKNISNNFDVERNIWYQLNVIFTGDAINEVSWRVDTTGISNVLYLINAFASPPEGGLVSGSGYYIFGLTPTLTATPSQNYIFTGWSPGIVPVICTATYTALFQYNDPTIHVTSVNISNDNMNLDVGNSHILTAEVFPTNATDKRVVWSSSNPSVATVDQTGQIRTFSAGVTTISVTSIDGGFCAYCPVTVYRVIQLYFHFERTAKLDYKDINGGYWYLGEPMNDNIYIKSTGGEGIPGSFTYIINWAYDASSGFTEPPPSSGTKSIIIRTTLHSFIDSGTAWGDETDFGIAYPSVTVTAISPSLMANPPTRIVINQALNTYNYTDNSW